MKTAPRQEAVFAEILQAGEAAEEVGAQLQPSKAPSQLKLHFLHFSPDPPTETSAIQPQALL